MKLTKEWLEEKGACTELKTLFANYAENDAILFLAKLIEKEQCHEANWLITRVMNPEQHFLYAIHVTFFAKELLKRTIKSSCARFHVDTCIALLTKPLGKDRPAQLIKAVSELRYAIGVELGSYAKQIEIFQDILKLGMTVLIEDKEKKRRMEHAFRI